jgi:hypothetical protein
MALKPCARAFADGTTPGRHQATLLCRRQGRLGTRADQAGLKLGNGHHLLHMNRRVGAMANSGG